MSNEARKFRKRHNKMVATMNRETDSNLTGVSFQHPVKKATPLFMRHDFQQKTAKKQEQLAKDRGVKLTKVQKTLLEAVRPARPRPVRNYLR